MAYTTIDDPSAHFQIAVYTGSGNDDKSIPFSSPNYTGQYVGQAIQPDLFLVKRRNSGTDHWEIMDTIRGIGSTTYSLGFSTGTDGTETTLIKSIQSDGMTLGTNPQVNRADTPYIAFMWKAGTTSSASESGSNIGYSRSINTTSKFMISAYTGTGSAGDTLAHGLGSTPKFWACKNRNAGGWSWYVYHCANTSAPETENLYWNSSDGTLDDNTRWDDTAPNSTEMTFGTNGGINADANNYINYTWGDVKGFSKFDSYEGTGNANGPVIWLGFRPSLLMIKRTDSAKDWYVYDNQRDTFNPHDTVLVTNSNDGELTTDNYVDFLSSGFKIRGTSSVTNSDGGTYVYCAWAEHPFVTSGGVPCPAR